MQYGVDIVVLPNNYPLNQRFHPSYKPIYNDAKGGKRTKSGVVGIINVNTCSEWQLTDEAPIFVTKGFPPFEPSLTPNSAPTLPLPNPRMGNPLPSSRAAEAFPAGLRVLIVDDDPTWLKILEKMLRKCSYQGRLLFAPIGCEGRGRSSSSPCFLSAFLCSIEILVCSYGVCS